MQGAVNARHREHNAQTQGTVNATRKPQMSGKQANVRDTGARQVCRAGQNCICAPYRYGSIFGDCPATNDVYGIHFIYMVLANPERLLDPKS